MVGAAVFTGVDQPQSIETLEAAEPGPGQVAVRMGASGVCHTEESIRTGALPVPPPMVLGHEGAGGELATARRRRGAGVGSPVRNVLDVRAGGVRELRGGGRAAPHPAPTRRGRSAVVRGPGAPSATTRWWTRTRRWPCAPICR